MRRPSALVAGLLLAVALTGCVGLPDDGPVEEAQTSGSGTRSDAMAINPLGPQPGQSPSDVVKGFLDAMQATPIREDVARQFLVEPAQDLWTPDETIVYDDRSLPRPSPESGTLVDVTLGDADRIDERGSWQGAVADGELQFTVIPEGDDFRIAGPPDALIVPRSWYAQRFRQVSLYFFDPTSQVLVPDPVFVPRGADLPSTLVQRLIAGPAPDLAGYARNLLPEGADPDISVPVSDAGVATVDLGSEATMPGLADRGLLISQLAWTLRQDSSVRQLSVQIDGQPVTVIGEEPVNVSTGDGFAPYVTNANTLVFGLDEGRMVAGGAQSLAVVSGPFGQQDFGLRSITPDLTAARAAGITSEGSTLYVGSVRASDDPVIPVVTGGTDLLAPAWDFSGRLWMIDRGPSGAVVSYLRRGRAEEVTVPLVSGRDVTSFLVSRDGSRLVAVVRADGEDEIVVSRLLHTPRGRFAKALTARRVDAEDERGLRIRDIAWLSPTSIVVLYRVGGQLFQVRTASVDGAPGSADDLSVTLDGPIKALAGTPSPDQNTYAIARGQLIDLTGASGGTLDIGPGITSLGYVG